jgi:hypothetical protein
MRRKDRIVAALNARNVSAWLEGDDLITVRSPGLLVRRRREEGDRAEGSVRLTKPAQETWSGYGLEVELLFHAAELRDEAAPDEVAEAIVLAAIV